MAAHERLSFHASIAPHILTDQLTKVLTKAAAFKLYHVSTPPTRTSALYSAPPGERPDRTYCENHFLAVSINTNSKSTHTDIQRAGEALVYAIEILIYSTAFSTTFFVSKADSTGYLRLLNLPHGSPSPLKDISATFLSFLVERRKRPGIRSIVSLFARAQGQYLFPGSSDNNVKHVLDDRGLIRWWCRVLDPLLDVTKDARKPRDEDDKPWESVNGFLKVPGLDDHDIKSYLPKPMITSTSTRWTIGHPLHNLSNYRAEVPPRCLVPRFPDDPKSRFLDELDEELTTSQGKAVSGEWKSVKTLDQFWEMMAYRQECSAGRLVGFLWIVFQPRSSPQHEDVVLTDSQGSFASGTSNLLDDDDTLPDLPNFAPTSPNSSFAPSSQGILTSSPYKTREFRPPHAEQPDKARNTTTHKKIRLSGPVIPRQPRVKTHNRMYSLERPEKTPYYIWPQDGRGQVVLDEKDYSRMTELLLRLDFANLDLALGSTERWISEVRYGSSGSASNRWGSSVTGIKPFEVRNEDGKLGVRTLNVGLVRKKRKAAAGDGGSGAER
jgi:regulator of Ty1 transposition protein 109